ncbi:MAG TPA: dephospho-CoA kinase [Burkholderiaceae bacterium]|nr:dephospho-CoA kinase [Burkholderiaceae bacterium]
MAHTATPLFVVGLTGGIGSGKSMVADLFAQRGAAIIDTDQIAHQLTQADGAAMAAIRAAFGAEFVSANGAMDRVKMRQRVFSDGAAKKQLEAILHPLIQSECERAASSARGSYLIFVVPLLVESGRWSQRVARVLVVDCPEAMQVERVMRRNSLDAAQVQAIMAAQATRAARLAAADDVITNDGEPAALIPQVERLHALYLAQSKTN